MKQNPVRFGIVGLGVGSAHADGIRRSQGGVLAALCDVDEKRLRQRARDWNVDNLFTDYKALAKSDTLDAICVCVPNYLHVPVLLAAMAGGKHVICEKPLTTNVRDAARAAQAAKGAARRGQICMMGFSTRFGPEAQTLKPVVDSGELGAIYFARASYMRRRGAPRTRSWFTDKALAGGGPLIDVGVHILETCWWLMGCPKPVAASGGNWRKLGHLACPDWQPGKPRPKFDVEDLACGLLRFANGAVIFLEASWAGHFPGYHNVHLYGDKAGAQLSPPKVFKPAYGKDVDVSIPVTQRAGGHEFEIQHLIDCMRAGRQSEAPIAHGFIVQKMLNAIYDSAEKGREVLIRDGK